MNGMNEMTLTINNISPFVVNLSAKSNWFFIRVESNDGCAGYGEGTLYGWEKLQLAYLEQLSASVIGQPVEQALVRLRVQPASPRGLVANSIISALEQALTDVRARSTGQPLYATLGAPQRTRVRMYANINRRTEDRTPQGFVASARDAVAQGYEAIKIAPFDGVVPDLGRAESRARIDAGIERIYATREAIGPDVDLLVDCHWRFDETTAASVLGELERAKLFWFECPISESPENYPALARLRSLAHRLGTRLAGAEQQIGVPGFRPFIEGGLLDIVMPDVKYAGGYAEMLRIAALCERAGVAFSPHNPTGPVCTMASLHVCALAPSFLILEHQVGESPLYYEVLRGGHPALVEGCFQLSNAPGLGIDLNVEVMRAHPYRPLSSVRDRRLG
jgi:galactonate dehydratase